jgi:hypothetical protein
MRQAHAQAMELTEVAINTTSGLMSGDAFKILGAVIVVLCAYIIYLHRIYIKQQERDAEEARVRDDKFTTSLDRNSASSDKIADAITKSNEKMADLVVDAFRNRDK